MPRKLGSIVQSANERFDAKYVIDPATGCHVWMAALTGPGKHQYGCFGLRSYGTKKTSVKAHRYAYERANGPIPDGLHLDHLCRNTRCVNPAHLEAVTPLENHRRADWKHRTHCVRGHALTPDNVYQKPRTGDRQCRECRKLGANRHYARHRKPKVELSQHVPGLLSLAFS